MGQGLIGEWHASAGHPVYPRPGVGSWVSVRERFSFGFKGRLSLWEQELLIPVSPRGKIPCWIPDWGGVWGRLSFAPGLVGTC